MERSREFEDKIMSIKREMIKELTKKNNDIESDSDLEVEKLIQSDSDSDSEYEKPTPRYSDTVKENINDFISSVISNIYKMNAALSSIEYIHQTNGETNQQHFLGAFQRGNIDHLEVVQLAKAAKALIITADRMLSDWDNLG